MSGGFERFVYSSAGYKEIMKSGAVQGLLEAKAQRVAAAVRQGLAGERDWEVITDTQVGRTRARVLVSGVPMRIEVDRRVMARAIDAAR